MKPIRHYFSHLLANWRVAGHAMNDLAEHFIHGLIPLIKWKHPEPHEELRKKNDERKDKE